MTTSSLPLDQAAQARLATAIREARSWRHGSVEPEHVLFTDLKAEDPVIGKALEASGTSRAMVKGILEKRLRDMPVSPGSWTVNPKFSVRLRAAMKRAAERPGRSADEALRWEDVIQRVLEDDDDPMLRDLRETGVDVRKTREAVAQRSEVQDAGLQMPTEDTLAAYCEDLSLLCERGKLLRVVGREEEIRQVVIVLSQAMTNNVMLVGDPGVGKTAIVEGLALRIYQQDVLPPLQGKRILRLDIGSLLAGASYRGEFEERLKKVVDAVRAADGKIILFVDEIHSLMGAGRAGGGPDAANLIKPALARGELRLIGATTHPEYRQSIEKDKPFASRFERITVKEPTEGETLTILKGIQDRFESHHRLKYRPEAIEAIVRFSGRYIQGEHFPRKAVKLMDRVGSECALARRGDSTDAPSVTVTDVARSVAAITGVPVDKVSQAGDEARRLEARLRERVTGQDEAIEAICNRVRIGSAGLSDPGRPRSVMFFLGTTGVGKTLVAKTMADELYAGPGGLVRIDMSEFAEKSNVQRLIGAPPGTIGYEEGSILNEAVKVRPYCLVLLDEFDKAHPDVWKLFMQVFDEGRLTDNKGQTVQFRNCLFVATSNQEAETLFEDGLGNLAARKKELMRRFQALFPPELFKRMDEILVFNPLGDADASQILDGLVREFQARMEHDPEGRFAGAKLALSREAADRLIALGFEPRYGARSLRSEFERSVSRGVADALDKAEGGKIEGTLEIRCQGDTFRAVIVN